MAGTKQAWQFFFLVSQAKPYDTSYTVTNLKEGTEYLFGVASENDIGLSKIKETEMFVKASVPPGKFFLLSIIIHHICMFVYVHVCRHAHWCTLVYTEHWNFSTGAIKIHCVFNHLSWDNFGWHNVFQHILEKPSAPLPPLEVVDHTRESLTLSWHASESDGGSPILHYVLEQREGWKTTWSQVAKVLPEDETLTYCVEHLKEGQDYYFRVYAENAVGTSPAIETETASKPRSPFSKSGFTFLFYSFIHVL